MVIKLQVHPRGGGSVKIQVIGEMEIDNTPVTGFFIEATMEEIKAHRLLFGEEVDLIKNEVKE